MSKKMNKMVLLSALMIAIIGTIGTVLAVEPGEQTVDLIAGGGGDAGLDVGNVTVWNNTENIYVEFTTTGDWCMTETHLQIATSVDGTDGIPQTKKGNPIPGKFEYFGDYDPCDTQVVVFTIPNGYETGDEVIIAAHAAVQEPILDENGEPKLDENGEPTFRYESAWCNGEDFEGKNWAMYFTYTIA